MGIFLGVSHSDAIDAVKELWEGRGYVWVEPNLVPAPPALAYWIVEWTTAYELRKLQVSWERTPGTGVPQDAAMCTFHFLNITAGVPDASWITADYTTVEGAFDAYWTAILANYSTEVKLKEYKWRPDGPAFRPFGSSLSPTVRITPRAVAGTGSGSQGLPPQVALSVTETTGATFIAHDVEGVGDQVRNRWGRYYLPAPIAAGTQWGRVSPALQTAVANAAETFYETCVTAQIVPVVYSPTTGHAWSVQEIHVDDIWDVIRSRRYTTPTSRAPRVITQL